MNEEMESLQKNKTWEFVGCQLGKKLIGFQWIYIVKYKVDDTIEHSKARLVEKAYTQTYGSIIQNHSHPWSKSTLFKY